MRFFTNISSILLTTLIFSTSCSDSTSNGNKASFGGQDIIKVDESNLTLSSDSASGSGSFVFNTPLAAVDSGASFS